MATVVTKLVKYTGGDYTTIHSALAALPASLVAVDEQWDIVLDESAASVYEWTVSTDLDFPACTTDATRFVRIKAATGKSFRDNTDKETDPLTYDASYGIAVRQSADYIHFFRANLAYTRFENIQFHTNNYLTANLGGDSGNVRFDNCLIYNNRESMGDSGGGYTDTVLRFSDGGNLLNQCVFIGPNAFGQYGGSGTTEARNCSFVMEQGQTGFAFFNDWHTVKLTNCKFVGYNKTAFSSGNALDAASDYNATSAGTVPSNFGSNSLTGLTAADLVESNTYGSSDARTKAGASTIAAGTRDQTYTADVDVVGRTRSTTTPTIGAWEYISLTSPQEYRLRGLRTHAGMRLRV